MHALNLATSDTSDSLGPSLLPKGYHLQEESRTGDQREGTPLELIDQLSEHQLRGEQLWRHCRG